MGGGRLGLKLAIKLLADGHTLTIIECDKERCDYLSSEIDDLILCGNATDKTTLENAEISTADVFVAATGSDESNLFAASMAKKLGAKKIIARLNEPQHEPVFASNNFINVIAPETIEAGYLEKLVLKPRVADLFVVDHGKGELLDIKVTNPNILGKTVGELNSQEDYFICGIYDDNTSELKIAKDDDLINEKTEIIVLAKKDSISKVLKIFTN